MLMILFFQRQTKLGERIFMKRASNDEIDLVFLEQLEDLFLGLRAVEKRHVMKRQFAAARARGQVGPVADDHDRLRAQRGGRFRQQAFEDMRFLRDENGQPLRADRREVDLRVHAQVARGFLHGALNSRPVEAGGRPRGLQRHAELAARDLFLHRLDVRAQLEEKLRDPRDDARLVFSDQSDGGQEHVEKVGMGHAEEIFALGRDASEEHSQGAA